MIKYFLNGINPVTEMSFIEYKCNKIASLLRKKRFSLHDEKVLQSQISSFLLEIGYDFKKEFRFNQKDIIDFVVGESGDIGIEVKISGNKRSIYNQVLRYLEHKELNAIILVTSRNMQLPSTINGKYVLVVSLSLAWI